MKPKYHRTVIQVEVLSEEPYEFENLGNLAYDIEEGDCSGSASIVEIKELTGKQMAKALKSQGSDPEFFQLDKDGNSIL